MRQHMEKMLKYRTRVFVDSETHKKAITWESDSIKCSVGGQHSQDFPSPALKTFRDKISNDIKVQLHKHQQYVRINAEGTR